MHRGCTRTEDNINRILGKSANRVRYRSYSPGIRITRRLFQPVEDILRERGNEKKYLALRFALLANAIITFRERLINAPPSTHNGERIWSSFECEPRRSHFASSSSSRSERFLIEFNRTNLYRDYR